MSELRDEVAAVLMSAKWPDGGRDGFPTRIVAEMLATALVTPLIERKMSEAYYRGWKDRFDTEDGDA